VSVGVRLGLLNGDFLKTPRRTPPISARLVGEPQESADPTVGPPQAPPPEFDQFEAPQCTESCSPAFFATADVNQTWGVRPPESAVDASTILETGGIFLIGRLCGPRVPVGRPNRPVGSPRVTGCDRGGVVPPTTAVIRPVRRCARSRSRPRGSVTAGSAKGADERR
jgi:hypothetical protein